MTYPEAHQELHRHHPEDGIQQVPHFIANSVRNSKCGLSLVANRETLPIVYANEAFQILTGYTQDDLIGCSFDNLFIQQTNPETLKLLENGRATAETVEAMIKIKTKTGEELYNQFIQFPLTNDSMGIDYFVYFNFDVTTIRSRIDYESRVIKVNDYYANLSKPGRDTFRYRLDANIKLVGTLANHLQNNYLKELTTDMLDQS